jgi:hypothetical protein
MTSKKSPIISVGYRLYLDSVKEKIFKILELSETDQTNFKTTIYAGVWYGTQCKGGLQDVTKSQAELQCWYDKRSANGHHFHIRTLHINHKKTLLVGEARSGQDVFYAFLYNKNNIKTTCQKKHISTGNEQWSKMTLDEPLIIAATAYIDPPY